MALCQLFLQSEAAYSCISELGELGVVQFKDLNPEVNAFQRKFVSEILRCDEMERKLRYIEKELKKDEIKIPDMGENPKAPAPKEMVDLEAHFDKIESELREVNTNSEALKKNFLELSELKEVLRKTQTFFAEQGDHHSIVDDAQMALVLDERGLPVHAAAVQLGFIAGVIVREKAPAFERLLWFACRGNVFLRYDAIPEPLIDPTSGNPIHKSVFIVFFQGEQLKTRVRKICEGFRATLYPCPETAQERLEMLNGVCTRLEDLKTVLNQTEDHRHRVLLNAQKEIRAWIIKVRKIKAIYNTLNMCSLAQNSIIAECWTPAHVLDQVQTALRYGTEVSGGTVPSILHRMQTKETPPTYFRTNKFTQVFQSIIEAYGVASYQEVNPAPYAIITFPFLFAVMFGDCGHGFILFLFGLWMVMSEKKLGAMKSDNEIWNIFFGGRYIIMMMGMFSVYTGLIYNDIFSLSLNFFGSSWHPKYPEANLSVSNLQLEPLTMYDNATGPYAFGLDPIWQHSENKITFSNSFKMKMSVILGIAQMLLGISLSLINHLHFRNLLNIFCEFIPEMVFMLCLFGYLIALVFYKWLTFNALCSECAPSLLIHFINMFLMKYSFPTNTTMYDYSCKKWDVSKVGCGAETVFYPNQKPIQIGLLVAGVLSVPVMLFIKPFVLRSRHNAKSRRRAKLGTVSKDALIPHEEEPSEEDMLLNQDVSINDEETPTSSAMHQHEEMGDLEEETFDFGEIFIQQTIHTIEYCLGCISHTASYLRLWALSLAHAQLSEVLWGMLFHMALAMDIKYGGGVLIFVFFIVFAVLTIAVLLVMEGLSAFLHTLRLHWVEFDSKFYIGSGFAFLPFSFKPLLEASLDEHI
ncbi:hypothetical protein ScPMuIL_004712 [Solemya velum]